MMQPSVQELAPGSRLAGRYRIEYLLAEGGMASIYVATDEASGQEVAVKSLYGHYSRNKIVRERFLDEGRIQRALRHPNIVHVRDILLEPTLAFVMELVNGPTLDEHLAQRGILNLPEVLEIMVPILSAIGLAHQKGIIHRDIKPSNILLTRGSNQKLRPMVMDFGVAKVGRTQGLTQTGTTVGTLHYMSPEQIIGSKHIDGRADIYSLGITLYKLCTGELPFNAPTEFALMMAQVESRPRPPSELNHRINPGLEAIVLKALNKRPQDRFQSIKAFTEALMALSARDEQTRQMSIKPSTRELLKIALEANEVAQDQTEQVVFTELLRELPPDQARGLAARRGLDYDAIVGVSGGAIRPGDDATVRVDEDTLSRLRRKDAIALMVPMDDEDDLDMMIEDGPPTMQLDPEENRQIISAFQQKSAQAETFDDGETVQLLRSDFQLQFGARPFSPTPGPMHLPGLAHAGGGRSSDSSDELPDLGSETQEHEPLPPRIFGSSDVDTSTQTRPRLNKNDITVSDPSGSISRDQFSFQQPQWGDDASTADTTLVEPLSSNQLPRPAFVNPSLDAAHDDSGTHAPLRTAPVWDRAQTANMSAVPRQLNRSEVLHEMHASSGHDQLQLEQVNPGAIDTNKNEKLRSALIIGGAISIGGLIVAAILRFFVFGG